MASLRQSMTELQDLEEQERPKTPVPNQDFEPIDAQVNVAEREDIPPDGGKHLPKRIKTVQRRVSDCFAGYGWICTLCVFLINAHTWGVNSVGSL